MLGIPLIASNIRPYAEWIDHGRTGFLVPNNRQHEWGRYLGALIQDKDLRRKIGLAARARASRNTLQGYLGTAWEEAALS
jgi:glycosyltransferase involved in cell wall biosynthesis